MLLFFQDAPAQAQQAASYIPLWVAIVGLIGTIVTSVGLSGIIVFLLTKSKFKQEVAKLQGEVDGQHIKNMGDNLKNFDLENEAFQKAAAIITTYRVENERLADENHELKMKVKSKDIQIAEEIGRRKQAGEDKDKVFERLEKLEDDLEFEKNDCQQKILTLGLRYEGRARWMEQRIETLANILRENNIEVPVDEYNEAEALKETVKENGNH